MDKPASPVKPVALLTTVSGAIFGYGMIASLAGTLVPAITQHLNISAGQIGDLFLAQALGMMIASLGAGALIDKAGERIAMLIAVAFLVLALFSLPAVQQFRYLLACMVLLGLGGGCLTTAASACISGATLHRKAALLSLTKCSYGLGGFATPWIGATLLAGRTLALCYAIGCLMIVLGLVIAFLRINVTAGTRRFRLGEALPLLRRPLLQLLCFLLFLYVACEVGMFNWLPKYLMARGIPETSALKAVSVGFALGLLLGRLGFAAILIKVTAQTVAVGASVMMLAGTLTLLQANASLLILAAVFVSGFAMAPVFPSVVAIVGDNFPQMTATAMGTVITSGWIGLAVSSRVIGYVSSHSAGGVETGFYVIPGFASLMIVVSLVVFFLLNRQKLVSERGHNRDFPELPAPLSRKVN
jgi:fucose permease